MKLNLIFISLLSMNMFSASISAANLQTFYAKIESNNALYQKAQEKQQAQQAVVSEARSEFLPHIGAQANYGYDNTAVKLNSDFPYIDQLPVNFDHNSKVYSYGVELKQNIINLQHWDDIQASHYLVAAQKLNVEMVKQERTFEFLKNYFEILQNKNALRLLSVEKKGLLHAKKMAVYRYTKGIGTKLDIYQTELALQGLATERLNTQGNLEQAQHALKLTTGIVEAKLQDVQPYRVLHLVPPKSPEYWLAAIPENNLQMRKAYLELQALKAAIAAQHAQAYPTIDAEAIYAHGQENLPIFNSASMTERVVKVNLKVPLFSGGYINAKTDKLRHDYFADMDQYQYAHAQLKNSVREIYDDILTMHAKLLLDQQAVIVMTKALKVINRVSKAGFKGINNVLDTEKQYTQAQLTYKKDAYEALLLRAKLYQLNGELDQNEIDRLNTILSKIEI